MSKINLNIYSVTGGISSIADKQFVIQVITLDTLPCIKAAVDAFQVNTTPTRLRRLYDETLKYIIKNQMSSFKHILKHSYTMIVVKA